MIAVLIAVAALVVATPMVAALVVSSGCRREDAKWSLGRPAQGRMQATARRIVAIDPDRVRWPRPKEEPRKEAAPPAAAAAWKDADDTVPTDTVSSATGAQAELALVC